MGTFSNSKSEICTFWLKCEQFRNLGSDTFKKFTDLNHNQQRKKMLVLCELVTTAAPRSQHGTFIQSTAQG